MRYKLILNDTCYPKVFDKIEITPPTGVAKVSFVEEKIIKALNEYNPKISVEKVEYAAIETQFTDYKKGNHNGVIVEEHDVAPEKVEYFKGKGYYLYKDSGMDKASKIVMYVALSNPGEPGRNGFTSQTVFPTIIDHIEESLNTSTYEISNHDFCFINISNKVFTANMILRHVCSLYKIGVHYVEVFAKSIDTKEIPKDLKGFLQAYATNFSDSYDAVNDIYEDDNYKIDFSNYFFRIKAEQMVSKLLCNAGVYDFNGSSEKFYWIEVYPMSIFAYKLGYKVDYSEYEKFVVDYKGKFSPTSEKFSRCEILLAYFKKYFV